MIEFIKVGDVGIRLDRITSYDTSGSTPGHPSVTVYLTDGREIPLTGNDAARFLNHLKHTGKAQDV